VLKYICLLYTTERRTPHGYVSARTHHMDNLIEQVVKKEKGKQYYLKILLILLGAVGLPAILIFLAYVITPYLIYVSIFVAIFCIYGVWFFISSLKVEYEYAFLSSTLRIDKVIAKRRRKHIVKVDVKSFDDFFRYDDKKMGELKLSKIYRAATYEFDKNNYIALFHSDARGRSALIFTPNEKLLEAMKPYFSADLRKKLFLEKKL